MRKVVTDEEFGELEEGKRHEELMRALDKIARNVSSLVEALAKPSQIVVRPPELTELKSVMKDLTAAVKELKTTPTKHPSGFRVQRGSTGLIERVINDG